MKTQAEIEDAIKLCISEIAKIPANPRNVEQVTAKGYWTGQLNAFEWILEQ